MHGGNDLCHCRHVSELQFICSLLSSRITTIENEQLPGRVAAIEYAQTFAATDTAPQPGDATPVQVPPGIPHVHMGTPAQPRAPLIPGMATANSTYGATAATATGQRPAARTALQNIGALGGLERSDGRLFEDKMTALEEFRFDGQKGGDRWKGRLERYFISKAPCLKVILKWVEEQDADEITERMLELAAGHALDERQREVLNTAIWGFLSNCIFGEAETIFKRAESLHGLDAWRRIVRHIDHGRSIRLGALRTEIRSLHLKPIKSLENVSLGIAEFENKINEYVEAGGKRPDEAEMKTDLLAMLPEGLRENLL